MPLLLKRSDFAPLFEDPANVRESFAVITEALAGSRDAPAEYTSWLAYPLGAGSAAKVHVNLLAASFGTSFRLFPPPTGPTVQTGDSICGLLDEAGRLVAIMDLHDLGCWRTSGVAAVACRTLAPAGARVAATLGSGVEARCFVRALREALPDLEEVRVYSRTAEHRERFAEEMATPQLPVVATKQAQDAVAGADIIYVNAAGTEPLFQVEWVRPGALVAAITRMGVPAEFPARLVLPDLRMPEMRPSGWDPWPVGSWTRGGTPPLTLAAVLRGEQARRTPEQTLFYLQLGVFAWDAPLIKWAYETAVKRGAGVEFQFSA